MYDEIVSCAKQKQTFHLPDLSLGFFLAVTDIDSCVGEDNLNIFQYSHILSKPYLVNTVILQCHMILTSCSRCGPEQSRYSLFFVFFIQILYLSLIRSNYMLYFQVIPQIRTQYTLAGCHGSTHRKYRNRDWRHYRVFPASK